LSKEGLIVDLLCCAVDRLEKMIDQSCRSEQPQLDQTLGKLYDAHSRFYFQYPAEFALLFQDLLLLRRKTGVASDLEAQFVRYIKAIERQLAQFFPSAAVGEENSLRSLAVLFASMISSPFSYTVFTFDTEQQKTHLKRMRRS